MYRGKNSPGGGDGSPRMGILPENTNDTAPKPGNIRIVISSTEEKLTKWFFKF
jgi:hypothetical protein